MKHCSYLGCPLSLGYFCRDVDTKVYFASQDARIARHDLEMQINISSIPDQDANTQLYNDKQNPRSQKHYFEVPRNHELTCKQIKNFRATRIGHSPTGSALQTIRRWRAVNFPFYYSFKNGKLRELLLKCEQKNSQFSISIIKI